MMTTSSFRSTVGSLAPAVTCSLIVCVLSIVASVVDYSASRSRRRLQRDCCGELVETAPEHSVESGERMNDVGERLQWRTELDGQYELTDDLTRPRRDQRRADEHLARAVGDQFD